MKERIVNTLKEVSNHFGVRIIHAVESGSRMWGFESPDSDWDVRFIYERPLAWYMSVRERRDVIELPHKYFPLDISGWDLRKALLLLGKSNPPLLEWLSSTQVYHTTPAVKQLQDLVGKYFNARRTMYHYYHMAKGNFRTYLQTDQVRVKKYFYVLRPLFACEFIHKHNMFPPVEFETLLIESDANDEVKDQVRTLLQLKRAGGELNDGPRNDVLNRYIEKGLEKFGLLARTTDTAAVPLDDLDEIFYQIVTGT